MLTDHHSGLHYEEGLGLLPSQYTLLPWVYPNAWVYLTPRKGTGTRDTLDLPLMDRKTPVKTLPSGNFIGSR